MAATVLTFSVAPAASLSGVSFTFEIVGEAPQVDYVDLGEINLFNRLTLQNQYYNLDGRSDELDEGSEPVPDAYVLTLTVTPGILEVGQGATVIVTFTKNGLPVDARTIDIENDSPTVVGVPTEWDTNTAGQAVFSLTALSVGTALISASTFGDEGEIVESNSLEFPVVLYEPNENYAATGYGKVIVKIENPLANAVFPRVQRLSNAEQRRKYPGDTGLARMALYEGEYEIVFMPRFLLK
jgi:hypothetical protein